MQVVKKKKKRGSSDPLPHSQAPASAPPQPETPPKHKDKGGRPHWNVTPKVIRRAARYARLGLSKDDIAWNLGVAPSTLYLYLRELPELSEAVEGGKARAKAKIGGILYSEALKRVPWAVMHWSRRHDPPENRLTISGDVKKPLRVFLGKIHEPIESDKAGDALAIVEEARNAKRANKKGGNTKAN